MKWHQDNLNLLHLYDLTVYEIHAHNWGIFSPKLIVYFHKKDNAFQVNFTLLGV